VYFAMTFFGLGIINVTDPLAPALLGLFDLTTLDVSIYASRLFYNKEEDYVVITMANDGYAILDVSNKSQPTLIHHGEKQLTNVVDVFIKNDLLFVAETYFDSGLSILNISNPTNPVSLTFKPFNELIYDIYVEGNLLFLSTELCPLKIYDISNPITPIKLSEIKTDRWYPGRLCVHNSLAFVAQDANGLLAIDVSNPNTPKLLTSYRDSYVGLSYDVAVYNEFIFLADGWDGLEILTLNPPIISLRKLLVISILPPIIGGLLVLVILISVVTKRRRR
jgi:hypothetical protein